MTLEKLLEWGKCELSRSGVPEAALNAWYLLQACIGADFRRSDYYMRKEEEVPDGQRQQYEAYVNKRKERMPLEYITGYTEFMGLPFLVDDNVLIPRQDTETLVELVYPLCEGKRVLDLCTGSGCIGLSIAVHGTPSEVVLSDISPEAVNVAEQNRERLCGQYQKGMISSPEPVVRSVCGDLFEKVEGVFDVIVSNPPYIESETIPGLMPEVTGHEPILALDGGMDGLEFYRRIIRESKKYLNERGMLCFEIGYNQGKSVADLMRKNGFESVEIRQDLAGNDRVVKGTAVFE